MMSTRTGQNEKNNLDLNTHNEANNARKPNHVKPKDDQYFTE